MREALFERGTSAILTSATLTTANTIEPFMARSGAHGQEWKVEASPFNYEKYMSIFIAEDAPVPSSGQGRLNIDYLADMIVFCAERFRGGTLVLFTSYADLTAVASSIEAPLKEIDRPLFAQGLGQTRTQLKAGFVEAGNAVLLGTDSFWTGFDVPGSALSQVILTRLPFANPNDPVQEARAEAIRRSGGNPFAELTLPDAVIQFRQGIGRLIRSSQDRGALTLLDSRILKKPYGRWFIQSLQKTDYQVISKANRSTVFPLES